MAEKDLELIHHKHFRRYPTIRNQVHTSHNKIEENIASSYASPEKFPIDKNHIPRNRPKFIYHKVSALSANTFPSESMFKSNDVRHSSRMITSSNERSNVTEEKIGYNASKTNGPRKTNIVRNRGKESQNHFDGVITSFSDRYLVKSINGKQIRPENVVAVSLPEHIKYKTKLI